MAKKPASAWVKPAALGGILLLLVITFGSHLGPIPPPGPFFNPFTGFWRNAEAGGLKGGELRIEGLREPVSVAFDVRGVPHIFAQNAHDLYFAQGYVTARDRLWQMEVQTHSAAGRLAEILGPDLVEHDRHQRRLGMLQGAERDLELMKKNPESWEATQAYAAGVNAHIASLNPSRYPIEYKLLGYAPEHWTPLKTALMIKNLQWTLSGGGDDLPMTNTRGKFGSEFMAKFFPMRDSSVEPILTSLGSGPGDPAPVAPPLTLLPGDTSFRPDTGGLRVIPPFLAPSPADSLSAAGKDTLKAADTPASAPAPPPRPDPGNGSNNFVVSGRRTSTGYPILANDPHLNLTLPSIWYEVQLVAPGINAYGVSLPGAPAVAIGFNRSIAWGVTNGGDDVLDWYRVEFKDSTLSDYLYAGNWRASRKVVEAIKVKGGETVLDTVVYTHHGPVVLRTQEAPRNSNSPAMHAARWLPLEPTDEILALARIMKATDYRQFAAAIRHFESPAQNFAFASVAGDIAMEHQGRFPRKWPGQGRFTLVGAEPGHDWQGWIPAEENPRSRNPAQGWLASANQSPVDSTYPHYLGASYLNGKRAVRLTQLVSEADSLTPEDAAAIMLDDLNLHAAEILPDMLRRVNRAGLSAADSAVYDSLAAWDYRHRPGQGAPAVFDFWWKQLYRSIWQDEFGGDNTRYEWPSMDRTRRLILEEPTEDWYDDITTPARETLGFLINRALREALVRYHRLDAARTWATYRPVNIRHLSYFDGFSRLGVVSGGCADCVNSLKGEHGPSWRMVVALGRHGPKAMGIYPGGQSGNPGSPRYDEFVADWAAGRFQELLYLTDLRDRPELTPVRLLLEGK